MKYIYLQIIICIFQLSESLNVAENDRLQKLYLPLTDAQSERRYRNSVLNVVGYGWNRITVTKLQNGTDLIEGSID